MNSESKTLRVRRLWPLVALAASLAGPAVMAAETRVFQWRDANGVVSYSQHPPPPGTPGVTILEIDTRTFTPAQRAAARAHLARIDAAEAADSAQFRAQLAAADQGVNRALQRLSQAERAARVGRVPRAGERVGNAGGGSRLRSDYFERQKQLEAAVEAAKAGVDEAYRRRAQVTP